MISDFIYNRSVLNFTQLRLFDLSSVIAYVGKKEWKEAKKNFDSVLQKGDIFKEWIEGIFPSLLSLSNLSFSRQYLYLEHRSNIGMKWEQRRREGKRICGGWWISPDNTHVLRLVPKAMIGKVSKNLKEKTDYQLFTDKMERKIIRSVMENISKLFGCSKYKIKFTFPISTIGSFYVPPKNIIHTYSLSLSFNAMVIFYLHYLQNKYSNEVQKKMCD